MGLRTRIFLAFLAVVSLLAIVGLVSVRLDARIQALVASIRMGSTVDLKTDHLVGVGIEVLGVWDDGPGAFVATGIERLPVPRRPKVRGAIRAMDRAARTITLYNLTIHVRDNTEFDAGPLATIWELLELGQRIEVSCRVVGDGKWVARKVHTLNVKPTDKIKGTVTQMSIDGIAPDTLEIDGFQVTASLRNFRSNPASPLWRIERASQMAAALQECRVAGQEMVGRWASHSHPTLPLETEEGIAPKTAEALLTHAQADFERALDQSVTALGIPIDAPPPAESGTDEVGEPAEWLHLLLEKRPLYRARLARLRELIRTDRAAAHDFLDYELDPFLETEMLPIVLAYRQEAERQMATDVRTISRWADNTTRIVLATSAIAVILAAVLAWLMWRSISTPLRTLHQAALAIGHGRFDTRIEIHRSDELGTLAHALNTMVEELATTTVSIAHLEGIIDSMASALVLADQDGRITRLNRAASMLLGVSMEELLGKPFATLCPADPARQGGFKDESAGVPLECNFRRGDGTAIPVALSHAVLLGPGATTRGYVYVAQDLSERQQVEARIRKSLAEKDLLLREVHHRVKNNLQVISSLLDLQSSGIQDRQLLEKLTESQSRIRSIALIHEQLYQAHDLGRIDLNAYLERLTAPLVQSFGRSGGVQLVLEVTDLWLDLDQALACGLIVNELVTNALKHAFPGDSSGQIRIQGRPVDGRCVLVVADNGQGIQPSTRIEMASTLGMRLVASLVQQLHGTLTTGSGPGCEVRVEFPGAFQPAAAEVL